MTDSELLADIREQRAPGARNYSALVLLALSAAAYFVLTATSHTLEWTICLVVAVLIHECGHLAAMKLYRYKNLKMLFIPGLGAMVRGQPQEHDAWAIAMIAIAGPLAGLAAAAAALAVAGLAASLSQVLATFAFLSVLLNAFNLAPIAPLDGGHFLSEALFARHPVAELIFQIAAVIALFGLAFAFHLPVLAFIGFVLAVSVGPSYRVAAAAKRLRSDPAIAGGELTEAKVGTIREAVLAATPVLRRFDRQDRIPAAVAAMWARVNKAFPGPARTALLIGIYILTAAVLVPLEFRAARQARVQSNPTVQANRLGLAALARRDPAEALKDFNRAIALSPSIPQLYANRGAAENALREFAAAVADFNRGITPKTAQPTYFALRGQAEYALGQWPAAKSDLDRALAGNPNDRYARELRAHLENLQGDFAAAATDYERVIRLQPELSFPRFQLALILRRLHESDAPAGLAAFVPTLRAPWLKAVGEFLLGKLTEPAFLAVARREDAHAHRNYVAAADYYAGVMRLIAGQNGAAWTLFVQSVRSASSPDVSEAMLARAELGRLSGSAPRK